MNSQSFPYEIYDSHHHLWDLKAVDYPWLQAKGIRRFFGDPSPIQKNYVANDFYIDIDNLPVKKTVHVQVGARENQHILESEYIQRISDIEKKIISR